MGLGLGGRETRRKPRRARAGAPVGRLTGPGGTGFDRQREIRLSPADQFQIDLGQQFAVEKRAVLLARANCRCRTGGRARRARPAIRESVAAPASGCRGRRSIGDQACPAQPSSALRNFMSKAALWMTSRESSPMKATKSAATSAKRGLSRRKSSPRPCTSKALGRHRAFGVEILVVDPAGRHVVEKLDRADLDDAVAFGGLETGGFGVEDDFTHRGSFSFAIRCCTAVRGRFKRQRLDDMSRRGRAFRRPASGGARIRSKLLLASCRGGPGHGRAAPRAAR